MPKDIIRGVEQFLYREARLLDERRFHDWLELFTESGIVPPERLADLIDEANQLIAVLVTCVKNAKQSKEEG